MPKVTVTPTIPPTPRLRGQRASYRPKIQPGVSVTLTALGHQILRATAARTRLSRSDVFETLLRKFAGRLDLDR